MTVSSTTSRITYAGNGSTTAFAAPFYFLADSDLVVIKTSSTGVQTTLALTTDYTVSGAGVFAGGTVTCVTAPATGETLVIYRDPAVTQLTDYQANDPFPAETHERALDKLTMITQRLKDKLSRAFALSDGDTSGASTVLPTPQANKLVAWNSTGTGLTNVDTSTLATTVAYGTGTADVFTGDGITTVFAMSSNPGADGNLDVSVGGVTQIVNVNFTWAGTNITFTSAPAAGVKILVRYMQGIPVSYTTPIAGPVSVTGTTTNNVNISSTTAVNGYEVAVRTANANQTWAAGITGNGGDGSWAVKNITSATNPFTISPAGKVTIAIPTAATSLSMSCASGQKAIDIVASGYDIESRSAVVGDYSSNWTFTANSKTWKIGIRSATGGAFSIYDNARTLNVLSFAQAGGATFNVSAATASNAVTFNATTMTLDCSLSNVFATTFTANVTVAPTISNPTDGQTINWFITQDATGSRTMTWPTSFKWAGGSAGVLSTAANSVDLLIATYRSATTSWYCSLSKGFA